MPLLSLLASSSIRDVGFDADLNEILNFFNDLGNLFKGICTTTLIISLIGCFFGFKLSKIMIALCGFIGGLILGLFIFLSNDNNMTFLLIPVCGIVLAILSYKLYKIGVFISSFVNAGIFAFLISLIAGAELKPAVIIAIVIGLIAGIISVILTKPVIIISTSASYGATAGFCLACLMNNSSLIIVFALAFIALGIFIQIKTNNGLFEHKNQTAPSLQ